MDGALFLVARFGKDAGAWFIVDVGPKPINQDSQFATEIDEEDEMNKEPNKLANDINPTIK